MKTFECPNCGHKWSKQLLADNTPCDDSHCRICSGRECPECGSLFVPREETVWYLIISNKHGMNVTVHGNPKSAESELLEYCTTSWDEEWDGPMPHGNQVIIDTYFQKFMDEWYELQPRTLQK